MHYLACVELCQGTVRGQHYHKIKEEHIYVLSGEFRLDLEDPQNQEHATIPMKRGDLVVIAPGLAHTLRVSSSGLAIEYASTRFDPADIHRYVIPDRA